MLMPLSLFPSLRRMLRALLVAAPWVVSLFFLYRMEYGEVWVVDMAFRSVISVTVLALGLALSFVLSSLVPKVSGETKR